MVDTNLFARRRPGDPLVFSIPAHRSFADALAEGLVRALGDDPLALARGRILLPTGRAVRTMTEAFVRVSGGGLLLPRLVAIGDPELGERLGGALDPLDLDVELPPAIDPLARQLALTRMLVADGEGAAEAMRLAADLARTMDALAIENVAPSRLKDAVTDSVELADHWQRALARFGQLLSRWPAELDRLGQVDLVRRRETMLRALAAKWERDPPAGFTIAAGITTSAPAIATLLARVARLDKGMLVLPGLAAARAMPDAEWEALGPDEEGRGEEAHPMFHLKRLLDRVGAGRDEVRPWRVGGRAASSAARGRAVVHALAAARFSQKWNELPPIERRLTGIRTAELPDPESEAQAIAIALREAVEEPGKTAALVTPDRNLATRVSAHLKRWDIDADDSAGLPLARSPAGTLLLSLSEAISDDLAPVALLSLLKHPLVGGEGEARLAWLSDVRTVDRALRGPRPRAGLAGLDERIAASKEGSAASAWARIRAVVESLDGQSPATLGSVAATLRRLVDELAGDNGWRGADGRLAADLMANLEASSDAASLSLGQGEVVPLLRQLMEGMPVRRPYGGHPRIFIWGLIEARLQQADLMILGGLNEGVWPSLPSPDPWLAPRIRRDLGLAGLEFRTGLAAHDFMSALGAPRVLLTRARRDARSPTVASRFWLRLQAMTGGLARDQRLERLARALDAPDGLHPSPKPKPSPPIDARPNRINVTDLDRLLADPYAFYAKAILGLRKLDPVEADHHAAWKGTAVHEVLEQWLKQDDCDPAKLAARAETLLARDDLHPMLRALWSPRLREAVEWMANEMASDLAEGRRPVAAEAEGRADVAGITLRGTADRIDRLADGSLAIVDYKTGQAPKKKAVAEGFALQLGLLSLIAERGGFKEVDGVVGGHEYWSLSKRSGKIGYRWSPDDMEGPEAFVERAYARFAAAVGDYLTGSKPFEAKLHPAYAPYEDYDQLMRLEEWYGRD
jgi:ATP-dependent helicase/nuclease subunit B